jgi:general stress protein 26
MDRRGFFRTGLAILGSGRIAVPDSGFPEGKSAQIQRERLLEVAREIMKAARYCALITLDSSGRAQARTMDAFPPDNDMVVWFGTNPLSRKVKEIERDPRVTLYYFDHKLQGYATILGRARLVDDPEEKRVRWKDDWKEFYPDRNKDYLLIAVIPERIEVVSPKHGVAGGNAGWTPPSVDVPLMRPKP